MVITKSMAKRGQLVPSQGKYEEDVIGHDTQMSVEYERIGFLVSLLTPTIEIVKSWSDWDYQKFCRLVELIWKKTN